METSNATPHDWEDFWESTDATPMTQTAGKVIDRDDLQDRYINAVIDGMSMEDMVELLYNLMDSDMDNLSCEELIEEVSQFYPELIDESAM